MPRAQGRIKSLYSIQRKMRRKGVPLEEVYDARALRVVIDDEDGRQQARCWLSVCRCWPTPQTSIDRACALTFLSIRLPSLRSI